MKSWIASHFKVARQGDIEWAVHCPAHDDKNPSASINIEKKVINCQRCGGMSLFKLAERMGWESPPVSGNGYKPANTEIARYDYRDESGKILYQQIRFLLSNGEKSFRGYNPETKQWKLEGIRRVPYRLPELLKAIESRQQIFICEGEKDVETLVSWGLCATTNSNGARSTKIWHEFSHWFVPGLVIFICPDADLDGMKHAQTVKEIFDKKQCKVRILNFGYPVVEKHGKDVTDWKAEGHDFENFINLFTEDMEDGTQPEMESPPVESDWGHACTLAPYFTGKFRYASHLGSWMEYTGKVWAPISDEKLNCISTEFLLKHYFEKVQISMQSFDKEALKRSMTAWKEAQKYYKIQGAINFLKGWKGILTEYFEWDQYPWLLNVNNGIIDLREGVLLDHDPDKMLTQLAPVDYDPKAAGAVWTAHLEKFLPAPDLRREVQRNLGLALCGAQNSEIFPIWYGTGANGKSTTIKAIQQVMGNYAIKAAADILIASKFDKHPAEIADLCGARLIFSVETDDQKRLAEAKVKELTGGDTIKARKMYGSFFQFEKTWTIFLLTNHKPIIRGTDNAIWRRVRLIPWGVRISDKDKLPQDEVVKYLREESPAILNWLLEGLRDTLDNPTWEAGEVKSATDDYRHDQDCLSGFLDSECEAGAKYKAATVETYQAYDAYCRGINEEPYKTRTFMKMMKDREYCIDRHGKTSDFVGIRLKTGSHSNEPADTGNEDFFS
jgi:putative DNA primase/helicase